MVFRNAYGRRGGHLRAAIIRRVPSVELKGAVKWRRDGKRSVCAVVGDLHFAGRYISAVWPKPERVGLRRPVGIVSRAAGDSRRLVDLRSAGLRRVPAVERVADADWHRKVAGRRIFLHHYRRRTADSAVRVERHGVRAGRLHEVDLIDLAVWDGKHILHAGDVAFRHVDRSHSSIYSRRFNRRHTWRYCHAL